MEKRLPFHLKLRQERLQRGWSQEDLASKIDADHKTVGRWEQGKSRPRPQYLQKIYTLFGTNAREMGLLEENTPTNEVLLSEIVPQVVHHPAHDRGVGTGLAELSVNTNNGPGRGKDEPPRNGHHIFPRENWNQAPQVSYLYGRNEELARLRQWIVDDGCRVVAVLGMGGVGKTSLTAKLSRQIKDMFEYVIWCSLQHAPPVEYILTYCIQFISNYQSSHVPKEIDDQITLLEQCMKNRRCLLVFDNVETLLQAGQRAGQYREGYEGYSKFIRRVGEAEHVSCLLLTSREKPEEAALLEGKTAPVRSLQLQGVAVASGREILKDRGLSGSDEDWAALVERYSGNPLALKLVAEPVQELFGGNIARFLLEGETAFGNISDLLDQQFHRLPAQERELLYWFAIEREALSLEQIRETLAQPHSNRSVMETLNSLRRRSMIETSSPALFTLQPVIMEYVTADLVKYFVSSFDTPSQKAWSNYALIKAQSKDYVRDTQIRLILAPVTQQLLTTFGKRGIKRYLEDMLAMHRRLYPYQYSYMAGNALNLLLYLKSDLRGSDFSSLVIRQAYLQHASLPDVKFAYAHFVESTFASTLGNVLAVAFSPHNDLLAAGTASGEIWLYEAESGRLLVVCRGHSDSIWSVAFSPNGHMLASSSDDMTIRLWETSSGHEIKLLEGHTNRVKSVAFNPAGSLLASGSEDQSVRVWNTSTGECLTVLHEHTDRVWCIAFSPDGKLLATGSTDQTVRLWDVESGQCLRVLSGHRGWVLAVAFNADGSLLASSGDDQTIRLWHTETGQLLTVLEGHSNRVRSVAFSPDGRVLASGSEDQSVRIWDTEMGVCLNILQGHVHGVRAVTFSERGDTLASGGGDQTLRLWDVITGRCLKTLQGYNNRVWAVAFGPDNRMLVSCSEDQTIRVWDSVESAIRTIRDDTHGVLALALSPNGQIIASGGEDRMLYLWDVNSGTGLKTLRGHNGWIRAVAFNRDGRLLASGGEDQTIRMWEVNTGRCLYTLHDHTSWIRAVAFSPNGQLLASAGDDKTIRFWEVATGESLALLQGHARQVRALAFSPAGHMLASGGEDQVILLWDVERREVLHKLHGHTSWVRSVAFSGDGKTLASSSDDQSIRLWDVESGRCVKILQGHTNRVRSVAFSGDGKTLASSSDDGSIKVWDVESGVCLNTLLSERPYERMDITGVQGLTEAQKNTLQALGARVYPATGYTS